MKVLLVDSHEAFRQGLALALHSDYGFDVLHTGSMAEAAALVHSDPVEVAVITYAVRQHTTAEFTSALRSMDIRAPVLILAEEATDLGGRELTSDIIAGVILKHPPISTLANAILGAAAAGGLADFPRRAARAAGDQT